MKRHPWFVAVGLHLALIGAASAAPAMDVSEMVHDFGRVTASSSLEHTFELRNSGDATLRITEVKPSCGCTVAELSGDEVAPGEAVSLAARLSVKGRGGPQQASVRVRSNDLAQPEIRLTLRARVVQPVLVRPRELFFGRMAPGRTRRQQSILKFNGPPGVEAGGARVVSAATLETKHDGWAVNVARDGTEEGYRVTVTFTAGDSYGRHEAIVEVETGSASHPVIRIPVSAVVTGELTVAPEAIEVKAGEAPETRYMLIALRRGGKPVPFELEAVRAPQGADIEVATRPVGRGAYRVRVRGVHANAGIRNKALVLETDIEGHASVEVPFRVHGQPGEEESVGRRAE